ncbi:Cap15 family cyclic dinucleotide receptor domain-containing protein [Thiohalobacter thiocyanaticus]|uniref:Cap15 family cyclic dinucleotide receptor domain-containing protein n=1 Tax=Thiohalobacter thiocyanaticus TaxID=585455 RepID=UPI000F62DBF3|nr:hypothetical protein [Thiohalobacter thiocyanaticus]
MKRVSVYLLRGRKCITREGMISLLPVGRVVVVIATLYASITGMILLLSYDANDNEIWSAIRASLGWSGIINIFLIGFVYVGWEYLWRRFPILNQILYPNLNGVWEMKIYWQWGDKTGESVGTAHIKQNFLRLSMEVVAQDSESETLMAKPKKDPESGRPMLFYMYRSIPKHGNGTDTQTFDGAAILKIHHLDNGKLYGNYFTNRSTKGHFELNKCHE